MSDEIIETFINVYDEGGEPIRWMQVKKALEAVAPLIRAQALEEAAKVAERMLIYADTTSRADKERAPGQ